MYCSMAKKNTAQAPLTPAVLHILLALSTGERHGYGIMKQVQADSQGNTKMGPGTLYGAIARLEQQGWIEPLPPEERRQPYRITAGGLRVLRAKLTTLQQFAKAGLGRLAAL